MAHTDPKRRRPRTDQRRNRQALLNAAREVFAEYGLDAPLDEIAKRAGLGNATLYRHFSDRRGLIIEVVLGSLSRHEHALTEALAEGDGWSGFTSFLKWLFTEQVNEVNHLAALRAIPAGENAEVDRLRHKTLSGFEELIARAKSEGTFRTDRWVEDIFLMLFLNEHLARLSETPQRAASQRFLELTLAAVSTPGADRIEQPSHEPDNVLTLRHTLGHDLAGLPRVT
ncbi:TetR/AcrR family transcriptional regulator [Micromonospora palomenae]|uniref:TetR/AcrR family transcriptional regulator n=1 Tax=Micromonospora palomenae TaxID=1461247 RepID=UPI003F8A24A5